jgi:hypothetical protein
MRKIIFSFIAAGLLFLCAEIKADEIPDQVLQLKEKIIELQNRGALGVKNLTPCSQITTIGSYTPLSEAKFKQEETLYVYFEPANFFTSKKEGRYEVWLTEDIQILSEKGQTLMEKPGVVDMHYNCASPVLDIYFNNHVEFKGVSPGKYIFQVVLYDKLKDASVSASLPFEVIEEPKPDTKKEENPQ